MQVASSLNCFKRGIGRHRRVGEIRPVPGAFCIFKEKGIIVGEKSPPEAAGGLIPYF